MSAIGDITGALAPVSQGITEGQLQAAQQQLHQQQYQDELGFKKQTAQNEAKRVDLEQQRVNLEDRRAKLGAVGTVLGEMDAEISRAPDSDADREHQAALAAVRDRVRARYAAGDLDGAVAELQHADNHAAANGSIVGLPTPAIPSPAPQGGGQGGQAAAAQAQIPPQALSVLAGLVPGLGLAQQAVQALPAQAAQAMQSAQAPGPNGNAAPIPAPVAQLMASLLGAPSAAASAPAPTAAPVAGPPPPPGSLRTTAGTIVPGQPLPENAQPLPSPAPAGAAVSPSPAAAPAPAAQPLPTGADKYAGLNLNSYERANFDKWDVVAQKAQAELGRPRRPDERYADYTASQARAEAQLKDASAAQDKIADNALARTKEENRLALEAQREKAAAIQKNLDRINQVKVAEIAATGHASDRTIRAEEFNLRQKQQLDNQAQGHEEKFLAGVQRAGQISNQGARVQMISLERNLHSFYTAAINAENQVRTGHYVSPNGRVGLNIGPLSIGGGVNVSNDTMVQYGRSLHDTPEARRYIQALDQIRQFTGRKIQPEPQTPDQAHLLTDRLGAGPQNQGEKEWVKSLLAGKPGAPPPQWAAGIGATRSFVDAFNALKVEDPFAAYRLAKIYRQMTGKDTLPAGASLDSIEHPFGIDPTGQPGQGTELPPVPTSGPLAPYGSPPANPNLQKPAPYGRAPSGAPLVGPHQQGTLGLQDFMIKR